jgi:uncharacterized protein (TIGR01777 family)
MTRKIIIAGGSGFIGKAIVRYFPGKDTQFVILGRGAGAERGNVKYLHWDGINVGEWVNELQGADAVINLTGKSVDCRYNGANKKEILRSRLDATTCIGKAILQCKNPPELWINAASATIYRHAEDRPMTEETGETGKGFSVEVCKAWERTFNDIDTPKTRKVLLRVAIVLGKNAGVMVPMTRLVRLGLGGRMGSGKQYFSWIHEKDAVRMIAWLIESKKVIGTFNCCAPLPVTNTALMEQLRKYCGVPFGIPQPKWLLEFGAWLIRTETELILKSRWVIPSRVMDLGFKFEYGRLGLALEDLLKK